MRDLYAVHPQEFAHDTSMFDRLVRMQHYHLPTRLLDVTANPLVALYFATEEVDPALEPPKDGVVQYINVPPQRIKYYDSDTISCIANLSNLSPEEKDEIINSRILTKARFNRLPSVDRLLQFIREEKPAFRPIIDEDDLDRRWYVVPKLNNRRIIAQNGAFIIFGLDTGRTSVPRGSAPIRFKLLQIPANKKGDIRRELAILGINQAALFPEIDYAADSIVDRYK